MAWFTDPVNPRRAFWKWALLGGFTAGMLIVAQVNAVGGLEGMLQVGESSSVRTRIETELDRVPLAANSGHDGQIYYAIGLDLTGNEVPDELDHGAYRYRRILLPVLASGLGLLDGYPLLVGLVVIVVVSTAIAAGTTAAIATRFDRSDWMALVVLLNPGVWLSVRLLTADILAMALMLVGLYWFLVGRRSAALAFVLSVLAKDVYLVTPAGLAVPSVRRRWQLFVIPAAVLAVWMTTLTVWMGDGFTGRGNLALPFVGMVDAFPVWLASDPADLFYIAFAIASVLAGLGHSLFVRSWLRWSILGWAMLAVISSNWVWDLGNNAARAFAPISVLIALAHAGLGAEESATSLRGRAHQIAT